eukprot:1159506-Pelagomonas_calceolata.AAC.8
MMVITFQHPLFTSNIEGGNKGSAIDMAVMASSFSIDLFGLAKLGYDFESVEGGGINLNGEQSQTVQPGCQLSLISSNFVRMNGAQSWTKKYKWQATDA